MDDAVTLNGIEYRRSIQHRCTNIAAHVAHWPPSRQAACLCHPKIPQPCSECYAIEVLSRDLPWSALGRDPQTGGVGSLDRNETTE